jgi:DEAD/DEAH box helicase domain-containing protein
MSGRSSVAKFVDLVRESDRFAGQVVHHEIQSPVAARYAQVSLPWPEPIRLLIQGMGLASLYSHQAEAMDHVRSGRHTVISTSTASGKTLVYTLPVLERILDRPGSRSLYLFPLKALAQDQLKTLQEVMLGWTGAVRPTAAIYDGDTPQAERARIRKNLPNILLTNPEMLHLGIMPHHHLWAQFLAGLDFVVVDEVHTYRGVMGSNMSWVFRRLRRLCRTYGADPTFIFCSATVGNPASLAADLTGLEVQAVTRSGAPQGKKHVVFINPLFGAARNALGLLEEALPLELRTIVYTQSRKMTELIAMWAAQRCEPFAKRISAYRSGFLPSERRQIEGKLTSGELLAVISTSALELGIDIGALDLCLLVGYPGSVMATWQRGGRVGRKQQDSGIFLLGHEDSLDQYFMANPEAFFQMQPEDAVLNPYNPAIVRSHLQCAAADLPLQVSEDLFKPEEVRKVARELISSGDLLRDAKGEVLFARRKGVQNEVNLRGAGRVMTILDQASRACIGSIDTYRACHETHPGAVYLHRGRTYVIQELRLEQGVVLARQQEVKHFTRVRTEKETEILERTSSRQVMSTRVSLGRLRITERITGYEKRLAKGQTLIEVVPLELEPLIFETEGCWLEIPDELRLQVEQQRMHFMGGIHALEHAMIGILPLLVLTDRNDLGGISQPAHPQLKRASIFVYDGVPGGVGLTRQAFAKAEEMLGRTQEVIQSCSCETGCPACVHSPKCGSGNKPLDKQAALALLKGLRSVAGGDRADSAPLAVRGMSEQDCPDHGEHPEKVSRQPVRYGVLDLETQRSAQDVGGWSRADRMGLSCAVLYDSAEDGFFDYLEKDMEALVGHLQQLDLVVGFNITRFDYQVLKGYTEFPLHSLPTLDMLQKVYSRLGYRLSLDHLASATLGVKKSGNGMLALRWWAEGQIRKIVAYCRQDVILTRDLYLFGRDNGHLLFRNKAKALVQVQVDW